MPKQPSANFKAKRNQHYNEFAAIQALRHNKSGDTSPADSDTSNEDPSALQTNTNTNINLTIPTGVEARRRGSSGSAGGSDRGVSPRLADEQKEKERAVSFSGGESGGEAQKEDFRQARQKHYVGEYSQEEQVAAASAGSVATNTNTNLNAGSRPSGSSSSAAGAKAPHGQRNPMEAGRPPVQFGSSAEAGGGGVGSSDEFRARRLQHYNEVAALRSYRPEDEDDEEDEDESSAAGEEVHSLSVAIDGEPDTMAEGQDLASCGRNPANPMEPRDPGVAFAASPPVSPSLPTQDAGWRNKRDAHYTNMAAALRNMPPPSDDEDDDDDA